LSHNETSTAKIDHKNEISAKNWVGSTWVAKSQLWKKSIEKSTLVNGQSQRKSQRSSQWSTLVKVNGHADVALGLTWQDDVALGLTGQETSGWARGRKSLTAAGSLGGAWRNSCFEQF
jgi:hypothetical protein